MSELLENLPDRLQSRLSQPLPGRNAHSRFEPKLCYGRHQMPRLPNARSAAVIAVFHQRADRWYVPMTLRPQHLPDHPGQICFPGGMAEENESSQQTALRELNEELGVADDRVQVIGQLSPIYVFGTNFWVTPFVGVARGELEFHPEPGEVAEVVDVPVTNLLDASNYGQHCISRRGVRFHTPHIRHEGHRIWGATCMMLGELIAILEEL